MLAIEVFGLPALAEDVLQKLHKGIVEAVVSIQTFNVNDETDMMVWFPADLMKYGLGTALLVKIEETHWPQPRAFYHRLYLLLVEHLRTALPNVKKIQFTAPDRHHTWTAPVIHEGGGAIETL